MVGEEQNKKHEATVEGFKPEETEATTHSIGIDIATSAQGGTEYPCGKQGDVKN
jgi:hypothetical protein